MDRRLTCNEKKLVSRTSITLIALFFSITVLDLILGNKELYEASFVILVYAIFVILNLNNNKLIKKLVFGGIMLLTLYSSLLCHYFYLDLSFIPIFCLLFFYPSLLFKGFERIILHSFIVLNISALLYLFKEQNKFFHITTESVLYQNMMTAMAAATIILLFYYIVAFYISNKNSKYGKQEIEKRSTDIQFIFDSIERRDNSFMPSFLSIYPDFTSKILKINNKIIESELEICALIMLGLTTKEIAMATNSTYKSIEARKYRIRKKLNLDSDTNLVLFFNSTLQSTPL